MNSNDVAAVLGILSAAWPNTALNDKTAVLWMDLCGDIEPEDAMHSARTLIKRERWFPTIAQFRLEAEANAHARRNRHAATRGLHSGHEATAPPPELVTAARELLADMRTKKHRHAGPTPCPVCGGMATPKAS